MGIYHMYYFYGIYESKFVVVKHFGCDVSPKESSAPFEYAFDRCVQF